MFTFRVNWIIFAQNDDFFYKFSTRATTSRRNVIRGTGEFYYPYVCVCVCVLFSSFRRLNVKKTCKKYESNKIPFGNRSTDKVYAWTFYICARFVLFVYVQKIIRKFDKKLKSEKMRDRERKGG